MNFAYAMMIEEDAVCGSINYCKSCRNGSGSGYGVDLSGQAV